MRNRVTAQLYLYDYKRLFALASAGAAIGAIAYFTLPGSFW